MFEPTSPMAIVRPLLKTRQIREFTSQPPTDAELEAITEAARWSGSSNNGQPWRFVVVCDVPTIRAIHEIGLPQTRPMGTAMAAIAIVLPDDPARRISHAYDDGRASERILIAASMLGLGAGITWIRDDVQDAARGILHLPPDRMVRTIVAIGHATAAASRLKTAPGTARRPRPEAILAERWPSE